MRRRWILALAWAASVASAQDIPGVADEQRAHVNYMLHCQGCHGPDGRGTDDGSVPTMKDFVARFLTVEGGRAFLVRVPGSANSAMNDAELAEVLNWMLPNISAAQLPSDFEPYSATEVSAWRSDPLQDVLSERARLIALMPQAAGDD